MGRHAAVPAARGPWRDSITTSTRTDTRPVAVPVYAAPWPPRRAADSQGYSFTGIAKRDLTRMRLTTRLLGAAVTVGVVLLAILILAASVATLGLVVLLLEGEA